MCEKRQELWSDKSRLFHHDDVSTHDTLSIPQFTPKKNIAALEKSLYSPDITLCEFLLSSTLKMINKASRWEGLEATKNVVTTVLEESQKYHSSSA